MLPTDLHSSLQEILPEEISSIAAVSGGCINHCFRLFLHNSSVFLKWNDANRFSGMLHAEARGLEALRDAQAIAIPKVLSVGQTTAGKDFLLLEWVESGQADALFWKSFGQSLAGMHQHTRPSFGFDTNNYIGSLPQYNEEAFSAVEFFIQKRLKPQLDLSNGQLPASLYHQMDQLFLKLPDLLPDEPPALIHGDLWSGNFLVNAQGEAVLIDPAVCFGPREMDLAMSRLFGGFSSPFYEAYQEAFSLVPGFEERIDLWNLYYLLVHVNLFGGSYLRSFVQILDRYTGRTTWS